MALIIRTNDPKRLEYSFRTLVAGNRILTWDVDSEGDYTISREQWREHAWMRPYFSDNTLIFGFVSSRRYPITKGLYGIYNGRLAATLLAHFDEKMTELTITPYLDSDYDVYPVIR